MTGRAPRRRREASPPSPALSLDWRRQAECQHQDPELFFPVGDTGPAQRQLQAAKKVCTTCAVVGECLQWAVHTGIDHGVWGGLSETERRSLKRRARRGPS